MKRFYFFILMFCCFPSLSFSNFKELEQSSKALESGFDFSHSSLKVVQKRWLPKTFLSEMSFAISPVLKGINYMNSYSADLSYRFFLNNHWALQFKYSKYFNPISQEGKDEVYKKSRVPLELKYPQKQSYLGGIDWYPFYGKAVLYNLLVRFDLYFSLLGGKIELMKLNKRVNTGFLALGLVCWWHKHFNTRLELQGLYYRYGHLSDVTSKTTDIHEYFYKMSLSAGVLF